MRDWKPKTHVRGCGGSMLSSPMFKKITISFTSLGSICFTQRQCDSCNKVLPTHYDFVNHFLYIHPPIQDCPKCEGLMRQVDFCVNPKEEWMIYKCEECGTLGDNWKVL